ncbi:hypothetical protein [Brevundimonas aurantiaca]|jgi:hypothetical protein|uniref:hypothetical protein n=1 Tax=Brevundimonas aurantiaca TaxID=74316 RepID=UPI001D192850|nr:hypothetical protein [Brevundimonas aurantiaca]MCC4295385.1 hypothetical protein [Brevundimonas aurantiaca]
MTIRTIDDGVLNSPEAEAYFTTKADRRVLIGFRAALEMLAIPLPEYARRKETGRPTTTKLIARQYAEDNPQPRTGDTRSPRSASTGLSAQQRRAQPARLAQSRAAPKTGDAREITRQASLFRQAFATQG